MFFCFYSKKRCPYSSSRNSLNALIRCLYTSAIPIASPYPSTLFSSPPLVPISLFFSISFARFLSSCRSCPRSRPVHRFIRRRFFCKFFFSSFVRCLCPNVRYLHHFYVLFLWFVVSLFGNLTLSVNDAIQPQSLQLAAAAAAVAAFHLELTVTTTTQLKRRKKKSKHKKRGTKQITEAESGAKKREKKCARNINGFSFRVRAWKCMERFSQMKWHMHCVYGFYTIQMDANSERFCWQETNEWKMLARTVSSEQGMPFAYRHTHTITIRWLQMVCAAVVLYCCSAHCSCCAVVVHSLCTSMCTVCPLWSALSVNAILSSQYFLHFLFVRLSGRFICHQNG